jgi:hypothetical protein
MLAHLILGREPSFDEVFRQIPPVGKHRRAPRVLPEGGRLVKSHERCAFPFASRYRKVVYLVRDGRDVSVSYYDWCRRNGLYAGRFEGFLPLFLGGRLEGYGAWHEHVRSWLGSAPARANALLVVRYEDLLEAPAEGLAQVAEFLGLDADREQIEDAVGRSTLDRTGRRPQPPLRSLVSGERDWARGIGRGSSGGWRQVLTPEERNVFWGVAGDVLAELGYEQDKSPAEPRALVASPRSNG